jgi:hypothetical protein
MAMDSDESGAAKGRRLQTSIRLSEVAGLIGVLIAGLSLFLTYADRRKDKLEAAKQAQAQSVLILRGDGGGDRIRLVPANPGQVVQSQVFYFPAAVRSGSVQITGEGRVDADWFAAGLKKALHGKDDDGAEHSLPVSVATTFMEDGEAHTDLSLYQIGFTIHPRLLQAAQVRLEGVALGRRGLTGAPQGAANAAWARQAPGAS